MKNRLFVALAVLSLCLAAPAAAEIRYVNQNASGTGSDGLAWATAYRTIQACLVDPSATECWVAKGTYQENLSVVAGAGIALYGGFNGTETNISDRNPGGNATTVDGGNRGPVVSFSNCPGGRVDGFIIQYGAGPGIVADSSTVNITGNLIQNNSNILAFGGGISLVNSHGLVNGNTISDNVSKRGGGLSLDSSDAMISWNSILNNQAVGDGSLSGGGDGGGIYIDHNLTFAPTIANNLIDGNTATLCGGIGGFGSILTVFDNILSHNQSDFQGGGICSYDCTNHQVKNNTIVDNYAGADFIPGAQGGGGGIFVFTHTGLPLPTGSVVNNIVAFNSSGIYKYSTVPSAFFVDYNDIFGNVHYQTIGVTLGSHSLALDPLFMDRANFDYHLRIGSPCINTGNNQYVAAGEKDFDGQERILQGIVEIGADELETSPFVVSTDPANGATGVSLTKAITLSFNGGTISSGPTYGSITLKTGKTSVVFTKSINGTKLTLQPATKLKAKTIYAVTIPAGAVRDQAGNPLAAAYTFSFTTGIR